MPQTLENKVLSRIYGKKRGWAFTPGHFRDLGSDVGIRKSLQNLADRGLIRRLARGLYDYPDKHPKLGTLSPTPDRIARALAGKDALRLQPSGAYAANLLGLSEQVPAKAIFLTDGMNKKIKIGRQEIILQQTTPKNMATADRTTGLVIQALRHLGQRHANDAIVAKLRQRLSASDRQQLLRDIRYVPAWIGDIFRRLADEET